jgi:hypothetical protein
MDMSFDFQPVYPHHDMLVELGEVEMAMECFNDGDEGQYGSLPDLESRMNSLLDALEHLSV